MLQTAFGVCTGMNNSISIYFDLETGDFVCVLVKMKNRFGANDSRLE
jgi:hypothetical protein